MSRAEELLNGLGDSELGAMALGSEAPTVVEEHIVIDADRYISVPESLKRIAVQYDHDIETVTFDCPRYWDGHDLSEMQIYINYMRADKYVGSYLASGVTIDSADPTIMHFDWVISQNVTAIGGSLSFLVCIKQANSDGHWEQHWNSELNQEMYISKGIENVDTVVNLPPDIVASLLERTDYVEGLVKPEVLAGYIDYYLKNNPDVVNNARNTVIDQEVLKGYVEAYLDKNPVNVEVDATLSKSGSAADSAVVGNEFDAVDTRFNELVLLMAGIFNTYTDRINQVEKLQWHSLWLVPLVDRDSSPIVFDTPDEDEVEKELIFDLPINIDLSKYSYEFVIELYGLNKRSEKYSNSEFGRIYLLKENANISGGTIVATLRTTESDPLEELTHPKYCRLTYTTTPITNGLWSKREGYYDGELVSDFGVKGHKSGLENTVYDRVKLIFEIFDCDDYDVFTPVETFGIRFSYHITGEKETTT